MLYHRATSNAMSEHQGSCTGASCGKVCNGEAHAQVPFAEKDECKALGARFDGNRKAWYAPDDYVKEAMQGRWQLAANQAPGAAPPMQPQWQPGQYGSAQGGGDFKVHYDVPFEAKDQCKAMGARFDGSCRKWCIPLVAISCACNSRRSRIERASPSLLAYSSTAVL